MKKSIVEKNPEECYLCGKMGYLEKHHIFHGTANRRIADKYGLTVHLCPECHRGTKGVHGENHEADEKLKQIGQMYFEERYGHDMFMKLFRKNYL